MQIEVCRLLGVRLSEMWRRAEAAVGHDAVAEDAIGGMSPGAGETVRKVSKRIRPPQPPEQENGSEVG